MLLSLSERSQEPLHKQISRQIRAYILSSDLNAEQAIDSIRGLARSNGVSVITVQKAYEELEREGLIYARRGKGFFVAEVKSHEREELSRMRLLEGLHPFLQQAIQEGFSTHQILELVGEILKELESKS